MFRFSDSKSPKEIDEAVKPRDIEPAGKMSDAEINDFWKAEFTNVKYNAEVDPIERLLSESFDRSEEDIIVDFDINESMMHVLDKFSSDNWETKDEIERLTVIKEAVQKIGDKLGLERMPSIVLYEAEEDNCGAYDSEKNEISINRSILENPIETLDTLMHELRHAYQRARAGKLETWEDQIYDFNFKNYINPKPLPDGNYLFYTDYQNQYVEADARAFADKITEAIKA